MEFFRQWGALPPFSPSLFSRRGSDVTGTMAASLLKGWGKELIPAPVEIWETLGFNFAPSPPLRSESETSIPRFYHILLLFNRRKERERKNGRSTEHTYIIRTKLKVLDDRGSRSSCRDPFFYFVEADTRDPCHHHLFRGNSIRWR